jgi:cysteinyl-tRNA synthetase
VRAEEEARKHHPFDFALWKGAKPQEPSFPSPWGPGRPGWHIECSAMVRQELGDTIDLHLGGADLIFPHHENEIAQSEAASGKPLARYWLHNGMVNVGGEKMSKSLGNFTTIRALLESGVSPMTLRFFVLQAHYRKPLDFVAAALEAAATGWKGLNGALSLVARHGEVLGWAGAEGLEPDALGPELAGSQERFIAAMDDDLNTSAALGELFELARPLRALANQLQINEPPTATQRELQPRWQLLVELAGVLGLQAEEESPAAAGEGLAAEAIEALVEQRKAAKAARNFAEADRIRAELRDQGVELVDKPGGVTVWIRE